MTDLLQLIPQKKKLLCQVPILAWEKVIKMVEEHHTVVVPAFYKRYDERFRAAKQHIENLIEKSQDEIAITKITLEMSYPGNPIIDNVEECLEIEIVHDIDLLIYLVSEFDIEITMKKLEHDNNQISLSGAMFVKKYADDIDFEILYSRHKEGTCKQMIHVDKEVFGYDFEISQHDGTDYWRCYTNAYKAMCRYFDDIPSESCDGDMRIKPFIRTMKLLDQAIDLSYDDDFIETYNAKHSATLPLDKHVYKPFLGTTSILSYKDGGLLKEIKTPEEVKIFKYLQQTELKKFIPEYNGKVNINETTFISMSDLTENYTSPTVLDVKMGQTSSKSKMEQQPFGFRCVGTVADPKKLCYTWDDLFAAVKRYLKDNKENYCRYEVLPYLVKQLKELYEIVSKTKGIQFKQVSLMLIYDALDNGNQKPTIHLVDFGKCTLDEKNENVDHYFCFGISSLIQLLEAVHDYYTTRDCVFLCRHGYRMDYSDLTWVPTAKYPHDPPLSNEGVQQAKDLAKRLKNEKIDLILTSPFYRATQTAKVISEELGIKYAIEPAFGEFLSINNRSAVPDLDPTLHEDVALDRSFTPSHIELSLETWQSMQERVHNSLQAISKNYHRVAIVSHRSTFQALLSVIVGKKFKYPLEFASITTLVPTKKGTGFVIDRINMFSHLSVFTESPYYNPNYAAKNYTDMIINENGDVMDS